MATSSRGDWVEPNQSLFVRAPGVEIGQPGVVVNGSEEALFLHPLNRETRADGLPDGSLRWLAALEDGGQGGGVDVAAGDDAGDTPLSGSHAQGRGDRRGGGALGDDAIALSDQPQRGRRLLGSHDDRAVDQTLS